MRGLNEVNIAVGNLTEKMDIGVDELVQAAAYDTNDDAIGYIRSEGAIDLGAGGGLISHQAVTSEGPRAYGVTNSSKYAPFIEWGTGRQVQVPDEWASYARQYKGPYPGTWNEFEENIKAWMQRHGIPERSIVTYADGTEGYIDVAYAIMVKILDNGLPARPFLYPAYVKNKEKLLKDIKKLFK